MNNHLRNFGYTAYVIIALATTITGVIVTGEAAVFILIIYLCAFIDTKMMWCLVGCSSVLASIFILGWIFPELNHPMSYNYATEQWERVYHR